MKYALVFAVLALVSCGNDVAGPDTLDIDGGWYGTVKGATINLTMSEQGGDITGSGSFSLPGVEGGMLYATGTRVKASVSITVQPVGYEWFNFSGTISKKGDVITGTASGSGFNNEPATLTRR